MTLKLATVFALCMACTSADALGQEIEIKVSAVERYQRAQKAARARRLLIAGAVVTIVGDLSVATGLRLFVAQTSAPNGSAVFSYAAIGPTILVAGALEHFIGLPL